ncbi:hypothetical protein [Bosea minatitlanensis]|uniref:Uncharacterized protein n=1 Tax=Bosea minatitlanensis TaxID=128782 RepID=A0ABW0EYN6_9HYPH|nr:hypothetical protein [Bosea minatitlanensis]MCT4491690.1 hypothetical protein [Bosea minatitlanensis]
MIGSEITLPVAIIISLATILSTIATSWGVVRFQASQHDKRIARLEERCEALGRELSTFEIEAAQRFVTGEALMLFKGEIVGAINRLAERLDRIIDSRSGAN